MNVTKRNFIASGLCTLLVAVPLAAGCGSDLATPEMSISTSGASSQGTSSSSSSGGEQPGSMTLFGPSISKIVFEVDYASGKAPYTGQQALFGDVWGLFKTNAERIFQGAPKQLTIPTELNQMEELSDVTGADFTAAQILAVAAAHRDAISSGDTATFYFVWLPGYFKDGTGVRKDVLGVNIGGSGVIAMFKDVIDGIGVLPMDPLSKYVEQATLVHEFGHAVGLVNNGITPTAAHQDEPHGAHCSNKECVMFFAIDGTAGAADFAKKYVTSQSAILFASDCLADIDAIAKAANGK